MKNKKLKKVMKHLNDDIKTFHDEASEDKELIRSLSDKKKEPKVAKKKSHEKKESKKQKKVEKVMREFSKGELHSGSKKGPKVKSRKQAVAIALSEARRSKKKK
jgi:hypothetical protein